MRSAQFALDESDHGLQAFARRQIWRAVGIALLLTVAFCLASLGTWNVADPSFSHATANPVTNAMGYPGAVFSDLAMQFFGLASVATLMPAVIWGAPVLQRSRHRQAAEAGRRLAGWSTACRGNRRLHRTTRDLAAADRARRRLWRHGAENPCSGDRPVSDWHARHHSGGGACRARALALRLWRWFAGTGERFRADGRAAAQAGTGGRSGRGRRGQRRYPGPRPDHALVALGARLCSPQDGGATRRRARR